MRPLETPPALPKEFKEKSNFELFRLIVPTTFFYLLSCAISIYSFQYLFLNQNISIKILSIPILLFSTMFAGLFLSDFSGLAHDGGHGFLHKNLKISFLLGILASSIVPTFLGVAYNESHWPHHKFTNTDKDPQAVWITQNKMPGVPRIVAFFVGGLGVGFYFAKETLSYLLGKSKVPNLTARQSKIFSIINILSSLATTFAWLALLRYSVSAFVLCFFIPWVWVNIFYVHFVYIEHAETGLGHQRARCFNHPLWRLLICGNYHIEHHIYPYVQRSKLYKVHKYLNTVGFHQRNNCIIESGFWSLFTIAYTTDHDLFKSEADSEWADSSLEEKRAG